ncbi:MAG TPA: serine hydrolase domain-containing protein [Acidimicrobiales bacterium]|nr:serine hydrolase domain-containing protein [Acidimicrobiales bacterium]
MTAVGGTWDDRFVGVRDAVANLIETGQDVGCSACVVLEGEVVADVWGGWADEAKQSPWERDTITNVWSTTKTMTALSALLLVDRGELDVDAPVARYWPEFAANGKDGVLVRHLLSHTAGLSGWEPAITIEELYDWDRSVEVLAAQAPWWEPGTTSGYHAVTQGQLVGEVVRRVAGVSLGTFFAKELAEPLGADFHIGTDPVHFARIAAVIPPPPLAAPPGSAPDSVAARTFASVPIAGELSWTPAWRQAEIPAANGHGNARSVARVQSVLSNRGELGGTRYLSEATCDLVFREQCNGTDLVLGVPLRHGIGYGLAGELLPLPNPRTCFWGGWGGSLVINDVDARMTVSYVMNRMGDGTTGDLRGASVLMAAYAALASG